MLIAARIVKPNSKYNVWKIYSSENIVIGNFWSIEDIKNFYDVFLLKRDKGHFPEDAFILSPDKKTIIMHRSYDDDVLISRKLIAETLIINKMLDSLSK